MAFGGVGGGIGRVPESDREGARNMQRIWTQAGGREVWEGGASAVLEAEVYR